MSGFKWPHAFTTLSLVTVFGASSLGCGQKQQQNTSQSATDTATVSQSTPNQPAYTDPNKPSDVQQPPVVATNPKPTKPTISNDKKPVPPPTVAKDRTLTVPAGTEFTVALETRLRTDSNHVGDPFRARTSEAIRIDSVTVLPAGSEVRGSLTHVQEPGRTKGKAEMTLQFEQVMGPGGKLIAISAEPIAMEGAAAKTSDEEKVAIGAVVGGVIGALTSKKKGKGALTGAAAGAAAGGAVALATKGPQLELASGQQFAVVLSAPVSVTVPALSAGK